MEFISDHPVEAFFNEHDIRIGENLNFSYPVFAPLDASSKKVILILHGLNERSWNKYLVWANTLAEMTGSFVILFPISFHINRSPSSWKDPRIMSHLMENYKKLKGAVSMSSYANFALSRRLSEDPGRFLRSGFQTVRDIENLLATIKEGRHEIVNPGSNVNIFAYSIGAFLAEILMISNPGSLFTRSKLFMFCGGSVFSAMNGTSRMIMDSEAKERLYNYYVNDFEKETLVKHSSTVNILSGSPGMAFRAMLDFGRLKKFRKKSFRALEGRIKSVSMTNDTVIPPEAVLKTLETSKYSTLKYNEIWDFPYPYSHENPFPVLDSGRSESIDYAFNRLITSAAEFFS